MYVNEHEVDFKIRNKKCALISKHKQAELYCVRKLPIILIAICNTCCFYMRKDDYDVSLCD